MTNIKWTGMDGMSNIGCVHLLYFVCIFSDINCFSRSNINPGTDNIIHSATSSNHIQKFQIFPNYNGNGGISNLMPNTKQHNAANANQNGYMYKNLGKKTNDTSNNQYSNPSIINPNYVFGSPQLAATLTNLPIFPYHSPTIAPAYLQFPQSNHPGNVLSPGYPHGLQPVNSYNLPLAFGQQSFVLSGAGTVPGSNIGILGGNGGGLAPPPHGSYQTPSMYKQQAPQQHNQNSDNRETQLNASMASHSNGSKHIAIIFVLLIGIM